MKFKTGSAYIFFGGVLTGRSNWMKFSKYNFSSKIGGKVILSSLSAESSILLELLSFGVGEL